MLGAGALGTALPASAANFDVASDAQLRSAISSAANGDSITFKGNITLSAELPQIQRSVTINGGGFTLSGDNQYRALWIQAGTVAINDLTIANAKAQGGNGGQGGTFGGGGGGGAGLGAGLFIAKGAGAALANVTMQGNVVRGGNGGADDGTVQTPSGGGGGGGYLGDGAPYTAGGQGGAGNGGNANGPTGKVDGQPGGFGGGGGGGNGTGGAGGFGGGGGGTYANNKFAQGPGPGGFGGGNGGGSGRGQQEPTNGAGGGGAGLGGAIFVQEGGSLTLNGGLTVGQNTATGGIAGAGGIGAAQNGLGLGSGVFLQGNGSLTLGPGAGQTQTVTDAIVDVTGGGGSGGSWSLIKNGAGDTILRGANAYSGGTTVNAGALIGTTDALKGNIVNNATLGFDQSGDGTYSGVISGTGKLFKAGTGSVSITAANSYGGGTEVRGGTLLFASDASLGAAGTGILLSGGTIGTGSDVGTINRPVTLQGGGIRVDGSLRTLTWSGPISGKGELAKSGNGSLILSGANTYDGGTSVTGGVLRFNTDSNLGAAGTGITLNGGSVGSTKDTPATTTFTRNITLSGNGGIDVALHPITWAGNIGGAGQFIKSGNGVLTLTGTNSYAGGTLVQSGILQVASDDKLGAAGTGITLQGGGLWTIGNFATARPITVQSNGGIFQTNAGETLTLTGSLDGPGGFTTVGTGTLVLAGTSSYAGKINANGGTIQGNASTIRGNIVFDTNAANPNARSVIFDQATDGTFAGNITGIGSLAKTGAGTLILDGTNSYSTGTAVTAGTLQGTSKSLQGAITNGAAVIFDQDFDGIYAGNMSGGGTLTKNGSGKLNLTGTSSVGGGTTINAGGFAVNGALTSNVTLNDGVLSGVGRITGNVTQNGGEIAPGNSIGNITIDGDYTIKQGKLSFEIDPTGASDRITIIGAGHTANLTAGTLEIVPLPGLYAPNTRYTIVTAPAGGIASVGSLAGGVGLMVPTLSFDPSNLFLTLTLPSNAFRAAGQTANQQAVGGALDASAAAGNTGGLVAVMANLNSGQAAQALQALGGQPYADFGTVNVRAGQMFMGAIGRQMAVARGAGLGAPKSVALADACDVACDSAAPRLSAWLSGIGSTGSVLGNTNAAGLTYTLGGAAFGIDYRLDPRFLFGIAGGYVGGTQWVNGFGGSGTTDALSVALYGSFTQGGFYTDALAGYANANNRLQRIVTIPGLPSAGIANGNTSANQFLGQLESGYRFALGFPANTSISPFARLQVGSVNQSAFTESGSSLVNLSVAAQTTTSVRTTLGVDLAASFDLGGGRPLDLGLRLGWLHEYADTARPMTAAFVAAPGPQFTVFGATPQRDSAVVGFSASSRISDMTTLFVAYDGEVGGGTDNHALRAGFRLSF